MENLLVAVIIQNAITKKRSNKINHPIDFNKSYNIGCFEIIEL